MPWAWYQGSGHRRGAKAALEATARWTAENTPNEWATLGFLKLDGVRRTAMDMLGMKEVTLEVTAALPHLALNRQDVARV